MRPTSRSFAAAAATSAAACASLGADDAHRDDDPAGLVRDGEADPLLAEVDREDAHDARS